MYPNLENKITELALCMGSVKVPICLYIKITDKGHCFFLMIMVFKPNTPVQFTIYVPLTQGQSRTNNVPCVYYAKDLRGLVNSLKSALMNFIDLPL